MNFVFSSRFLAALAIVLLPALLACSGGGGTDVGSAPGNTGGTQPPPAKTSSKWSAAGRVSDEAFGDLSEGNVAVDGIGSAFLILRWAKQDLSSAVTIFQRQVGMNWGAPQPLNTFIPGPYYVQGYFQPQVHSDDSGNALASWYYLDRSAIGAGDYKSHVFVANYNTNSGWGVPLLLQSDPAAYADRVTSVIQHDGRAWAVWIERTFKDPVFPQFDNYAIFAAGYSPQTGWAAPEKVTGDYPDIVLARVAADGNGNPTILWLRDQFPSLTQTLYHTNRTAGGVWSPSVVVAEQVLVPGVTVAIKQMDFDIAVDSDGNAIAAWMQGQGDGTTRAVFARRYTPAGGWEDITRLMLDGPDGGFAMQLAMDSQGNAFVAWYQFDGLAAYGIWTARFDRAAGWSELDVISSPTFAFGEDSTNPKLAFDQSGNAIAIWNKYDFFLNRTVVRANRYNRDTGWGKDETISSGIGVAFFTTLAVSTGGRATAVWSEEEIGDGSSPAITRIWTSSFSP